MLALKQLLMQDLLMFPPSLLLVKGVRRCRSSQPLEVASVGLLGCGDQQGGLGRVDAHLPKSLDADSAGSQRS